MPIRDPVHQSMLQWIDVYVINMIIEIFLIQNNMRPISTLPDGCFSLNLV